MQVPGSQSRVWVEGPAAHIGPHDHTSPARVSVARHFGPVSWLLVTDRGCVAGLKKARLVKRMCCLKSSQQLCAYLESLLMWQRGPDVELGSGTGLLCDPSKECPSLRLCLLGHNVKGLEGMIPRRSFHLSWFILSWLVDWI